MKYKIILCILLILLILFSFIVKYYYLNNNIEKFTLNNLKDTEFYVLYVPKREQYIKNVLKNLNFRINYILGPDKNKLKKNELVKNNTITPEYSKKTNTGRIACHLGHLKILEEFLKTDKKYAIIFEDDIKIDNYKETERKIKTILENLPDKFDIIYFDYCWSKCKKTKKYNDYLNHTISTLCRHFYLVSRNGAQIIVNNTLPMYHNGDNMYADLVKNKKLISFDVRNDYFNIKQNREQLGSELLNDNGLELPKCVN